MSTVREDIMRKRADGSPRVQEVATLVFYIRHPHRVIADGVIRHIRAFVDLVSYRELTFAFDDNGHGLNLNERSLELLLKQRFDPNVPNGHLELESGEQLAPAFGLAYSGNALTTPGTERETSSLQCWVPRRFFLAHRSEVEAFFDETARTLPFTFAYLSYGLSGDNMHLKQGIARRYPGLDIADPTSVEMDLGNKAAGVYWLNLLGPELTAKLGGMEEIRNSLPDGIEVGAFSGDTCRIRLGEMPEIGDVNRRQVLPLYRVLAGFFEERGVLHPPQHVVYHIDETRNPDREAMEAWHRRFLE